MIDLNAIRSNPAIYKKACQDKRIKFDVDAFLVLDDERRMLVAAVEAQRAELNALSKEVPQLKGEDKEKKLPLLKELSTKVKDQGAKLKDLEEEWYRQQLFIPSIPSSRVPLGKDDSENVEVRTWGEKPKFSFDIKDHVKLGKDLDIIDIERGVKIAGARNYFLKGDGARLHHAVLNFALDFIAKRGFTIMDVPHIVQSPAMVGTGYFPGGEEMAYHFDERDKDSYLIGTSEVALVSYFHEETVELEKMPIRCAGFSPCYRREAGSYGKDTHGLYRVHQFYKVEQVVICEASEAVSAAIHKELLTNAEELMQALGLPYRIVDVCSGDLGQGQVYKNDIETWMPSRGAYSETHSCSTLFDFQSRRLDIRYKDKDGKRKYCHTLNNTLIASPRVLIPILEMNQQADGTVRIPKALQAYMGGQEVIG